MGNAAIGVFAGFCAGVAEVLIGHPFDTIKTKIQTQDVDRVGDKVLYKGPVHCAAVTLRREGLGGLYRGIASPLVQNAVGVALLFGAMDYMREHWGATIFAPHRFVLACCLIGAVESVIYCPLDHIKTRLQVGNARTRPRTSKPMAGAGKSLGERHLAGALQVMRDVVKAKGPLGLYHGWVFQLLKEVIGDVALFGVYDLVMVLLGEPGAGRGGSRHAHPEGLHWLHIWPAGSLAGMAYYSVGFPFDTMKSRMQADSLTLPRYKGSLHAAAKMLHEEGSWKELYRGLSTCLLRALPGSAAQFIVFELVFSMVQALVAFSAGLKLDHRPSNIEHFADLGYIM